MWHVRRAAVLALPSLCKCLPRPSLRSQAVKAIVQFGADDNRNVRSGALEVCGELVYLFHEDPDGVPDELLAFFLGKPSSSSSADSPSGPADRAPLPLSPQIEVSPLVGGLDSPPTALLEASQTWSPVRPWPASRDPDREILTAFNFPAVVLTLGRSNWHLLRDAHRTLCQDHVEKVRQSLASSLHEVAKIIGPEQSDQALLEPLSWFLHDGDNIQAAVLETLPSLLASFTPGGAARALAVVADAWGEIRLWRQREHIAGQLAEVGPGFMNGDGADAVLGVLVKAFKDSVAAVREQAVLVVRLLPRRVFPGVTLTLFSITRAHRSRLSSRRASRTPSRATSSSRSYLSSAATRATATAARTSRRRSRACAQRLAPTCLRSTCSRP